MARITTQSDFREWRPPNIAGGLCLEDLNWKIRDNQCSKLQNMWYNDRIMTKRWGQEYVNESVSSNPILAAYDKIFKGLAVFHCGTKLYTMDVEDGTTTEIKSGLTAARGSFFVYDDILYYINGTNFVKWNGATASDVVGKIPVVLINSDPAGGGDTNENYNRLSPGFTVWFNSDNTETTYFLPQLDLDDTTVICFVGGVELTEDEEFTVNRAAGTIDFSTGSTPHGAPATGQNNVKITAYKTNTEYENSIKSCKYATSFGGEVNGLFGGTRIFISGGPDNRVYYSALGDPTYWPDNNYNLIGSNDEVVTGFGKQYDVLVVFKPSQIFSMRYSFDGTNVTFPVKQISDKYGCDCPYTIQLIDNNLVWLNSTHGVYTLVSTFNTDERNVKPISTNINGTRINPGLLEENNLTLSISVDYQGKYWLCTGTHVWLWDYSISPYLNTGNTYEDARKLSWFYFTNINANCWFTDDVSLYYGDRTVGKVTRFIDGFTDYGQGISAVMRTKMNDFGLPEWQKTINELWISTRTDTNSQINITYYTDQAGDYSGIDDAEPIITGSFSWSNFNWSTFTSDILNYLKTYKRKPKIKKVIICAIELSNDVEGRDMAISDFVLKYRLDRKVK